MWDGEITERRNKYRSWKRKEKKLVKESISMHEEINMKMSEKFDKHKKLFWKEVTKERGGVGDGCMRVMSEDGVFITSTREVTQVWKGPLEHSVNKRMAQEVQEEIKREGVKRATARLKCRKTEGINGITSRTLKYGRDVVAKYMF